MNLILLIATVLILSLGLLFWFYWKNTKLRMQHALCTSELMEKQLQALDQMRLREKRLGQYRFTDYNLQEVLIKQSGISL